MILFTEISDKYSMLCADLFEDAETDLAQVSQAQTYAHAFLNWLNEHNADTPLGEIDQFIYWETLTHKGVTLKILSVSARQVGVSEDDLSFGIAWSDDTATERGWLLAGYQENRRHYYALLMARDDPRQETDVVWGLSTHSLTHEVIHYLDYRRGYNAALYKQKQWQARRERETGKRPTEKSRHTLHNYYNDPLELNAHFQQALAELFTALASNIAQQQHFGKATEIQWLGSFAEFYSKFEDIADRQKYQYLPALTRRNKQKIVRRLYKLYTLIKHQWPNLPEIKQQAAEFVRKWREDDERSASSADGADTAALARPAAALT